MDAKELRTIIKTKIPDGSVVPRHTERQHFYEVLPLQRTLPSVTAKLQVLKDESLMNYKMNRAVDYVALNWKKFTDDSIGAHLESAKNVSSDILKDAGDIGTDIHQYRENYFNDWIKEGKMPAKPPTEYIDPSKHDIRAISAMRALYKFVIENNYEPVVSEQLVYDAKFGVAGTLDDLGIMDFVVRVGDVNCEHSFINVKGGRGDIKRCMKCGRKTSREFVLLDIKTSNQFKDHYFFQVAMYFMMFRQLTGLKPKKCLILKLSKENGTYQIEDLRNVALMVQAAKSMLILDALVGRIKDIRKDNQKTVLKI